MENSQLLLHHVCLHAATLLDTMTMDYTSETAVKHQSLENGSETVKLPLTSPLPMPCRTSKDGLDAWKMPIHSRPVCWQMVLPQPDSNRTVSVRPFLSEIYQEKQTH
ncbi:mCG141414, isoform CRA_a [Mus musculus]|nr:mCG141414, isoform CRA_a [Mus musculus]